MQKHILFHLLRMSKEENIWRIWKSRVSLKRKSIHIRVHWKRCETDEKFRTGCGIFSRRYVDLATVRHHNTMLYRVWTKQQHFYRILISAGICVKSVTYCSHWIQILLQKSLENQMILSYYNN